MHVAFSTKCSTTQQVQYANKPKMLLRSLPTSTRVKRCHRGLRVTGFLHEQTSSPSVAIPKTSVPATTLKVAAFSSAPWVKSYLAPELNKVCSGVTFYDARLQVETARLAQGVDAVLLFVHDVCDQKVAGMLAKQGVKLVCLRATGSMNIDVQAINNLGMRVVRVPKYRVISVAEHAVALMFALNRKLHTAYRRVTQGNYALSGLVGTQMYQKTVGIIGTGSVGTETCRKMLGIGCKVLAYDRVPSSEVEAMGIQYVGLEELLRSSDFVSLHLSQDPENLHFINRERLAMMKPGAMLVNVAAGELIDIDAVMDALQSEHLGSYGADVYEGEGGLFDVDWQQRAVPERMHAWDRRFRALLSYPQVLFTPHTAFLTAEGLKHIAASTVQSLEEFAQGRPLSYELKPSGVMHGENCIYCGRSEECQAEVVDGGHSWCAPPLETPV